MRRAADRHRRRRWAVAAAAAVATAFFLPAHAARAADPAPATPATQPSPARGGRARVYADAVRRFDKAIADNPKDAVALQGRGLAHFRLGQVEQAVADFDRFIELEPEAAPHHWQRGIALYYVGRYADGAKQFEVHRTVNPQDVENAVWHFLCVARAAGEKGIEKARASLIPIKADARVPMMQVHALFAGKATPDDVLAAAKAGEPEADELNYRLFYAHLYLGLYHEAAGQTDLARRHVHLAAETHTVDDYMGDVARVHVARMERPATRPAGP